MPTTATTRSAFFAAAMASGEGASSTFSQISCAWGPVGAALAAALGPPKPPPTVMSSVAFSALFQMHSTGACVRAVLHHDVVAVDTKRAKPVPLVPMK